MEVVVVYVNMRMKTFGEKPTVSVDVMFCSRCDFHQCSCLGNTLHCLTSIPKETQYLHILQRITFACPVSVVHEKKILRSYSYIVYVYQSRILNMEQLSIYIKLTSCMMKLSSPMELLSDCKGHL